MKVIITGSGTSHGIPVIACSCKVCRSKDPKDARYRCSAYIEHDGTAIVIDTGPEFRLQAVRHHIDHVDGVLITHGHSDHLFGLDDLRVFSHTASDDKLKQTEKLLTIYSNSTAINVIRKCFYYIFNTGSQLGGGKPLLHLQETDGFTKDHPLLIKNDAGKEGLLCYPVPMMHGKLETSGWNIRPEGAGIQDSVSYLTDCSYVSPESIEMVKGTGTLVIDGLRMKPHPTHFSFMQALECADAIKPSRVYLTHICHTHSHQEINCWLKEAKLQFPALKDIPVEAAWDGLEL